MTPGKLLVELFRRGVRVEANGDQLRYFPRSRMTPELVELLRQHKAALLKTLGRVLNPPATEIPPADTPPVYVYETPVAPREKASSVDVDNVNAALGNGWLDGSDELPDLEPCPKCDSLELWQSAGLGPHWRCGDCDPPTTALRLLEHVEQIRARSPRPTGNTITRTSPNERSRVGSAMESPTASCP